MAKRTAVLILVILVLAGCKSRPQPRLILDGWWDLDYAKNACAQTAIPYCAENVVTEVRDFEARFSSAFASDASCSGITLIRFAISQNTPEALNQPAWSLSINYIPQKSEQDWAMLHDPDGTHKKYYGHTTGNGTPSTIAHTVCGIIKGKGGTLND
jgi:hypothetical protein